MELDAQAKFNFPSGSHTAGMNMGQIIQIAFELRNITQQALDEESSSADEDGDDATMEAKRKEIRHWFKFCKEKVEKIEKVWNRKLEQDQEDSESAEESGDNERPALFDH